MADFAKADELAGGLHNLGELCANVGEQAVVRGEIDVASGYPNNAAIMMAAGAKMEDIKIIPFSSLGLKMYGNGIIVNGKFLKSHPEAVKQILRAFNRGIKETVAKAEVAVKAVLERDPRCSRAQSSPKSSSSCPQ